VFAGHYGAAFVAKRIEPRVPLWVLFVAVQLVDVAWALLVLAGIEKARIDPRLASSSLDLYYMPYTHGLPATVLWALAVFGAVRLFGGAPRVAAVLAAAVASHWLLDLVVHRPDLPLWDDTLKVGLGVWNFPRVAFALELLVVGGSVALCLPVTEARRRPGLVALGLALAALQAAVLVGARPRSLTATATSMLAVFLVLAWGARLAEAPRGRGGTR